MIDSKIMETTKSILKEFGNTYFSDKGTLKRNKVIEDLDAYTPMLMKALLANQLIHDTYTESIVIDDKSVELFKLNQFIEMFTYKEYWQDSYTKFENKIGLTAGGKFIDETADVVLDFPCKDTVLKAGMTKEDQKDADEPFLHETIAKAEIDQLLEPKIFVNATKYDQENLNGVSTDNFDDDNLIIKGNNLIALHSLKEKYAGAVKLIYLDPPYNTGSDSFAYNDRFNHSSWLTFMRNRLIIAKKLLSKDGVIAVQTDYHENSYLRVMLDELFGRDKFISEIAVKMSTASGPKMANISSNIPKLKDSIIIYKKESMVINKQPYKLKESWDKEYSKILMNFTNEDRKILDRGIKEKDLEVTRKTIESCRLSTLSKEFPDKKNDKKWLHENAWRIVADKQNTGLDNLLSKSTKFWNGDVSAVSAKQGEITLFRTDKEFGKDTRVEIVFADNNLTEHVGDLWTDISTSGGFSEEGGVKFPTAKKPEKLLKRLIEMFSKEGDIVLDFFAGSATTLAASLKLNRKFVGIEQMDYIDQISIKRLQNVISGETTGISKDVNWQGGGSFVYAELMEKNQGYLKDVQHAETTKQLENVVNRMIAGGADFDFRVDVEKVMQDPEYQAMSLANKKQLMVKVIDKNQLYYAYSDMEDRDVQELMSESDIAFNKSFYGERDL
ncbi:DNA methyltransferase [Lactiplantibacillus plantarum]|jgi:adenine-specific DNA-methyltransferase|uniref:DNA methyltransferase n=2 Tax=Lactiplantibacillus plantarum TaxID=1590 RepID=UPI003F8826BA